MPPQDVQAGRRTKKISAQKKHARINNFLRSRSRDGTQTNLFDARRAIKNHWDHKKTDQTNDNDRGQNLLQTLNNPPFLITQTRYHTLYYTPTHFTYYTRQFLGFFSCLNWHQNTTNNSYQDTNHHSYSLLKLT